MITLTTPAQINSVLGGNAPINYDKLVVSPLQFDAVGQTINAQLRITSTANSSMQPIIGSLRVSVPSAELVIEVPQLDFYRRVVTSGPQNTSILAIIETAQKGIEDGLISLSVISGVRSAGA